MRRLLVIAVVLASASPASGSTFRGSCHLAGTVAFDPPLTNMPKPTAQLAHLAGTCDGRFVDAHRRAHELSGAPVTDTAWSEAPADSCAAGTAYGFGTLTFPYGRIRFRLSETRLAAFPLLTFDGRRSGAARTAATPSTSQDPVAALQACAGAGVTAFAIDGRLQTTPQISG